eukprot:1155724-Pelagomonas_calceolata.AAC.1
MNEQGNRSPLEGLAKGCCPCCWVAGLLLTGGTHRYVCIWPCNEHHRRGKGSLTEFQELSRPQELVLGSQASSKPRVRQCNGGL